MTPLQQYLNAWYGDADPQTCKPVDYYSEKLKEFSSQPARKGCVVLLGDSITDFCDWDDYLQDLDYINRGIAGDQLEGIGLRLSEVARHAPSRIFLLAGANNFIKHAAATPETVLPIFISLIEQIKRTIPDTQLFVQSLLPIHPVCPDWNDHYNRDVAAINVSLAQLAPRLGYTYVDIATPMTDQSGHLKIDYTVDGCHLSDPAFRIWADIIQSLSAGNRNVIGIGETVLDIIFRNDAPQKAVPGGSTFNAMISLGRTKPHDSSTTTSQEPSITKPLAASIAKPQDSSITKQHDASAPQMPVKVAMVTEVGDDHVGDIVVDFMKANGVSTEYVTRNQGTQSHISLAFLDDNNDAQYEFYKDHAHAGLSEKVLGRVRFQKDDLVLFGSYFAINPVIRDHTRALLTSASAAGSILYYDINFRKNHQKDLDQTLANIEENIRLADFVRGSAEDFRYLYGLSDGEKIYNEKIAPLCRNFILTRGSDPTEVYTTDPNTGKSVKYTFEVPQVETVSTIGAGDNFNAGFLHSILSQHITKSDVDSLTASQWSSLVASATLFSTSVCLSLDNYVPIDFL